MSGQRIDMDPKEFAERLTRFEQARDKLHALMKSWDDVFERVAARKPPSEHGPSTPTHEEEST